MPKKSDKILRMLWIEKTGKCIWYLIWKTNLTWCKNEETDTKLTKSKKPENPLPIRYTFWFNNQFKLLYMPHRNRQVVVANYLVSRDFSFHTISEKEFAESFGLKKDNSLDIIMNSFRLTKAFYNLVWKHMDTLVLIFVYLI